MSANSKLRRIWLPATVLTMVASASLFLALVPSPARAVGTGWPQGPSLMAAVSLPAGSAKAVGEAGAARATSEEEAPSAAARRPEWVVVDYGALVDRRRLTHSGEAVGVVLHSLGGRPVPPPGERPADGTAHVLLEPLVEPYAFVLADALDSRPAAAAIPWTEVGSLWQPAEAQPAWAELLRSRRFVVESDGAGQLRLFLPWSPIGERAGREDGSSLPAAASAQAAEQAWEAAWPILRHAVAAEIRRLHGQGSEGKPGGVSVEVYPYVHFAARSLFHLGTNPFRTRVEDTRGFDDRPSLDLDAWQSFLERGLQLEGGRLEPDGTIRLFGSPTARPPTLLGLPLALADFAVAYRAVFHGGLGEPYMSLDRGMSPQTSLVNYGGRLQDTGLGLVSLLCDIRFKTFSLGIDIVTGRDRREAVRRSVPSFRTHMERFAADARSQTVLAQQTRLWFYPDAVDLTLSPQGDLLALRRVRMSAASERVQQQTLTASREPDPPWTAATVAAINGDYEALSQSFPEMADLDQVVRLLSFFTWLRQAGEAGLQLPDLDLLLALELPAQPTPRHFPQLLAFNALAPPETGGSVEVVSRVSVGEALDRLQPRTGEPLPASRRFERALVALDRQQADHAGLARELESYRGRNLAESDLDLLAYRAERLRMHQIVLNASPEGDRPAFDRLKSKGEGIRTISVGIGGLDLGMGQALSRASGQSQGLQLGPGSGRPRDSAAGAAEVAPAARGVSPGPRGRRADPATLPRIALPDHGPASGRATRGGSGGGASRPQLREHRGHWTEVGAFGSGPAAISWVQVVTGSEGPEPRSRRVIARGSAHPRTIERVESGRFLRYTIDAEGAAWSARPAAEGVPPAASRLALGPAALGEPAETTAAGVQLPAMLATLEVGGRGDEADAEAAGGSESEPAQRPPTRGGRSAEAPSVRLRVGAPGGREMAASVPRTILQRLVLGRSADLLSDRPLPGLAPAESILGEARTMMVMVDSGQSLPPWAGPREPLAGEEDPVRLASALADWWRGDAGARAARTVVGVDPRRSPERWRGVSGVGEKSLLLLPEDGFPGPIRELRQRLAALWTPGEVAASVPETAPALIVLISAEDPALLGARLRALARDARMKNRLLAVWPLGGPVRPDLPPSLIAEGNLAGLGLAEYNPLAAGRVVEGLGSLATALKAPESRDLRPADLPGPLLWYF